MFTPPAYAVYKSELEGFQELIFFTPTQSESYSIKGDLQLLSWAPLKDHQIAIPGYPPILFSMIAIIFLYLPLIKIGKKTKRV